jgi:monovalent cation/hydrogen antiporter
MNAAAGIHGIELVLLLLMIFVTALAALAKKWEVPYPIILVIGGLILSVVPHVPHIELSPNVVFLVILPPLLFSAAYETSWRDFEFNLVSITMLAFGLVGFTVAGVALAAPWFLPNFDWKAGLVLGAVVSTTDAIAATSIGQRLGLPKSITDVIEGESLINDASGLLALQFATALLVSGQTPGWAGGAMRLLYLVFGSIALGLVIGKFIEVFIRKIEDPVIEITISLVAPYFAYLAGESSHASGVMATVACGLYLGHKSSLYLSTGARLTGKAVWETLTFVLNGLVFVLIGFQLPSILPGLRLQGLGLGRIILHGLMLSGVLIVLRLLWMFPGARISNIIRRRLLHQNVPVPNARGVFIVGWTGMRGVVALAAAISLPEMLDNGQPFPHRGAMIFLTFCVILVTLVLQGLTLPPLIRHLGLADQETKPCGEEEARRAMIEAALAYLEHSRDIGDEKLLPVYNDLIRVQRRRLKLLTGHAGEEFAVHLQHQQQYRDILGHTRAVQRATILHMFNEHEIDEAVLRQLEHELDLNEARFAASDYA